MKTTYRAEVSDIGGCGVGTSVLRTQNLLRAVRYVATTTSEPWGGPWQIIDESTNAVLMEGTT